MTWHASAPAFAFTPSDAAKFWCPISAVAADLDIRVPSDEGELLRHLTTLQGTTSPSRLGPDDPPCLGWSVTDVSRHRKWWGSCRVVIWTKVDLPWTSLSPVS